LIWWKHSEPFVLALDPLVKGVEGVGKIVPKAKPEVKKPKIVRRRKIRSRWIDHWFAF
jgi:hypothetical protein